MESFGGGRRMGVPARRELGGARTTAFDGIEGRQGRGGVKRGFGYNGLGELGGAGVGGGKAGVGETEEGCWGEAGEVGRFGEERWEGGSEEVARSCHCNGE